MNNFEAIKTIYNGYKFRSRLEAKWAVFFDNAKIKYEYEPEGYVNKKTKSCYLPDFYLPEYEMHVEVKPLRDGAINELRKASEFIGNTIDSLLVLGNIPRKEKVDSWHWNVLYYNYFTNCLCSQMISFEPKFDEEKEDMPVIGLGISKRASIDLKTTKCIGYWGNVDYLFVGVHEKELKKICNEDIARGDLYTDDEIRFINKCYDKARQAQFEHGVKG